MDDQRDYAEEAANRAAMEQEAAEEAAWAAAQADPLMRLMGQQYGYERTAPPVPPAAELPADPDGNELFELDKRTATAYGFVVTVPERTATPEVQVMCGQHNYFTDPHYRAPVRTPWDVLEFIEGHEREHHR